MVRRIVPLVVLVAASVTAACRAELTAPAHTGVLLRDSEEPECVDTVYEERTTSNSVHIPSTESPQGHAQERDACHIVVIYY